MNDSREWERYGALGGFVFVVLVVVSIVISGSPPKPSDSADKILKYFGDNKGGLKVGTFLGGLATIAILAWAGSLWARLRRSEGGQPRLALIVLLGLLLGGATQAVAGAINATVALELKDVAAPEAKFFLVLSQVVAATGTFGLAAMVFATSILVFRTGVFPVWLGWIGVVDGIAWCVAGYAVASTADVVFVFGFVAFIIWAIWVLVISVIMFREKEPVPDTPLAQRSPAVA